MLILSRKLDEAIWIGDNIKIKIMGIEKGTVKIGIEAPSDITILRQELKEAVAKVNQEASSATGELSDLQEFMRKLIR
ncbi:MAG: carbon storage regulator CsrA [Campylobacterales bacterium]|nr:carbon storage regulator CsrA [Campylobacterales bacterium]MBE0499582.1 carbon storage regulator CsrA [Campylobacterales bacterium]